MTATTTLFHKAEYFVLFFKLKPPSNLYVYEKGLLDTVEQLWYNCVSVTADKSAVMLQQCDPWI